MESVCVGVGGGHSNSFGGGHGLRMPPLGASPGSDLRKILKNSIFFFRSCSENFIGGCYKIGYYLSVLIGRQQISLLKHLSFYIPSERF